MLIFYGNPAGKLLGPYHPDEMRARAAAVHMLNGRSGLPIYMIRADTYEQARRKLPRK